eukprot:10938692-Alexandrium_andersonii.AAC.1
MPNEASAGKATDLDGCRLCCCSLRAVLCHRMPKCCGPTDLPNECKAPRSAAHASATWLGGHKPSNQQIAAGILVRLAGGLGMQRGLSHCLAPPPLPGLNPKAADMPQCARSTHRNR